MAVNVILWAGAHGNSFQPIAPLPHGLVGPFSDCSKKTKIPSYPRGFSPTPIGTPPKIFYEIVKI